MVQWPLKNAMRNNNSLPLGFPTHRFAPQVKKLVGKDGQKKCPSKVAIVGDPLDNGLESGSDWQGDTSIPTISMDWPFLEKKNTFWKSRYYKQWIDFYRSVTLVLVSIAFLHLILSWIPNGFEFFRIFNMGQFEIFYYYFFY